MTWWMATALTLLLLLAAPAFAQDFPKFTGLVVDAANVIPADRKAALEAKLEAFQQKTHKQLVVATVPGLGGDDIQDYGYKLARAWGVGLKGVSNGTILLVAPSDRKIGIEVGYGEEGVLTDAYSSVVIQSKIVPAFKAGDLPGGIDAGTDALIDVLSTPDDEARAKTAAAVADWNKAHRRGEADGVPWGMVVWLLIIGFIVLAQFRRHARYGQSYGGGGIWPILMWDAASHFADRDRGGWSGGSFGDSSSGGGGGWGDGGFTGGGGGSFGGGGASGGW